MLFLMTTENLAGIHEGVQTLDGPLQNPVGAGSAAITQTPPASLKGFD
jgi:hypothetical protein